MAAWCVHIGGGAYWAGRAAHFLGDVNFFSYTLIAIMTGENLQ